MGEKNLAALIDAARLALEGIGEALSEIDADPEWAANAGEEYLERAVEALDEIEEAADHLAAIRRARGGRPGKE